MSACDFICKCLWVASVLHLGVCVLFQWNGSREFGGSEKQPRSNLYKISISMILVYNSESIKIARLNFFKELREFWMRFPSSPWKPGLWAVDLLSGLEFANLPYQQLFTPVEKDLWTMEVELCVWSGKSLSTKSFTYRTFKWKGRQKPPQNSGEKEAVCCEASGRLEIYINPGDNVY